MTSFICRNGGHDATYAGPYKASGVSMRAFFIDGKYSRLAVTLDRYLNAVASDLYLPVSDRVIACFAAMERVEGVDPSLGAMREVDVALFIPTIRFAGMVPKELVFFAPYLFVDIPQAAFTGREVHGYRKDIGTSFSDIDIYASSWKADCADITHVDGWAVPAPKAMLQRKRLFEIIPPAPPPGGEAWAVEQSPDIVQAMHGSAKAWDTPLVNSLGKHTGKSTKGLKSVIGSVVDALYGSLCSAVAITVPIVFLRQFRDPRKSVAADVCEVITADVHVPACSLSTKALQPGYGVRFYDTASHPFSKELGVSATSVTKSTLTVDIRCDFTLDHAR